jgi:hypothetical protein
LENPGGLGGTIGKTCLKPLLKAANFFTQIFLSHLFVHDELVVHALNGQ